MSLEESELQKCMRFLDSPEELDTLLKSSQNRKVLCMIAYANIKPQFIDNIEAIHSVLIKHASAEDHIILEERLLELLAWDSYETTKKVYNFILSHPEYKWCDRNGNFALHYLAITRFHLHQMKELLSL